MNNESWTIERVCAAYDSNPELMIADLVRMTGWTKKEVLAALMSQEIPGGTGGGKS